MTTRPPHSFGPAGAFLLSLLVVATGCADQPLTVEPDFAVVSGTAQAIVMPLHGVSPVMTLHRERGGSSPYGKVTFTDDGSTLTIDIDIAGLVPAPLPGHADYDLYLRFRSPDDTTPARECSGARFVRAVLNFEAADSDGRIRKQVVKGDEAYVPLVDFTDLELLWDETPIACGAVVG